MYNAFQHGCERLLRIPPDPRPPPGDETSTRIFRAAPNFFKYLFVIWALSTLGIFAIVAISIAGPIVGSFVLLRDGNPWGWTLLLVPFLVFAIFALVSLFRLAVLRLDFEKRWYIVTDRSLRVREGVIGVQEMTVTFANIQNISIAQGPVQRALGIADLRVETAGGGGGAGSHPHGHGQNLHVARFRGIDNAAEVRALIQERLRQWKDAGLGDHDDLANGSTGRERRRAPTGDLVAALGEVRQAARALRETVSRAC